MQDEYRADLEREARWFCERAVLAHLDGYQPEALQNADRCVRAVEELHRIAPEQQLLALDLADVLITRAEIRLHLPRSEHRAGVSDATAAIALYAGVGPDVDPYPLRLPNVWLVRAELHSNLGHHRRARRDADEALSCWRAKHTPGDEYVEAMFAHTLSRYGFVVRRAGDAQAATEAWRESVERARPSAAPGGSLWRNRFAVGTTRITTPTLARYSHTAFALAEELSSYPDAGWEALQAFQDAAEGCAALGPVSLWSVAGAVGYVTRTMDILRTQAERLRALGELALSAEYAAAADEVGRAAGVEQYPRVAALRAPLVEAAARHVAG